MKALALAFIITLCSACQWISPQAHEQIYTSSVPEEGWTSNAGVDIEILIPPMSQGIEAELQCRYSNAVDSSELLLEYTISKAGRSLRSQSLTLPLYAQTAHSLPKHTRQGVVYRTLSLPMGEILSGLPAGLYTLHLRPQRNNDQINGVSSLGIKLRQMQSVQ